MLFNSFGFIFIFLPISFVGYYFLNKKKLLRLSLLWLVLCSLFFYGYWDAHYLPLLLFSVLINFSVGRMILSSDEPRARKTMLVTGVVINILLLAYFKYAGFFLQNIHWLVQHQHTKLEGMVFLGLFFLAVGPVAYKLDLRKNKKSAVVLACSLVSILLLYHFQFGNILANVQWFFESPLHASHVILPIGISFFTFTQIAFLVDVYLKKAAEYRFKPYLLFVSYYPHLLAGPIIHHAEMMPQFISKKNKFLNYHNIYVGLALFTMGLFKKVVIADTFAIWSDSGYAHVVQLSVLQSWATVLSYTFQLYFDFSGYCDMAVGISWLFNIRLPINFNSPYKSLNIQDFWRRWHITLGRFLKNYLYIFIGGNRVSQINILRNFLIVFLVGGIWHGAGWTFIVWGLLHAFALCTHHLWRQLNVAMPKILAWLITFGFINLSWIFFRAPDLRSAFTMLGNCFRFHTDFSSINPLIFLALIAGFIICCFVKNTNEIVVSNLMSWKIMPLLFGATFFASISAMLIRSSSAFLYFQF